MTACTDDGISGESNGSNPSGSDWDNEVEDYASNIFNILNTGNCYLGSEITQADDGNVGADGLLGIARNTGAGQQTSIGACEYDSGGAGGLSIPVAMHHYTKSVGI